MIYIMISVGAMLVLFLLGCCFHQMYINIKNNWMD